MTFLINFAKNASTVGFNIMPYYIKVVDCGCLLCVETYLTEDNKITYDSSHKKEFASKKDAKVYSKKLDFPDKEIIIQEV